MNNILFYGRFRDIHNRDSSHIGCVKHVIGVGVIVCGGVENE